MRATLSEKAGDAPVFTSFLGNPPAPADPAKSALGEFFRSLDFSAVPEWAEGRLERRLLAALAGNAAGRHLLSFFDYGGFYSADAFVSWLERKLDEGKFRGRQRHFGRATFAELFEATGVELSLTASDTTMNRLHILNHRTTPDLPVAWGARMSMSFPLVWQEVVWREEWGPFRATRDGRPVEIPLTGHVLVDGGMLSNFPIELFVSREPGVTSVMGPRRSAAVLGFLIDESLPVKDAPPPLNEEGSPLLSHLGSSRTAQRLRGLVDTMTSARDKAVIDENRQRVVRLPAKSFKTLEFNMCDERRDALIAAAATATRDYFVQGSGGGLESMDDGPTAESDRIAINLLNYE
jgi:predicted acylesterase/phospholipase RssA